jgi:glucan 1,4-alpha-glucosidase
MRQLPRRTFRDDHDPFRYPRRHGRRRTAAMISVAATALLGLSTVPSAQAATGTAAPGAPGAMSHFDLARKDCLGTARNTTSKVWFTVAGGVLSDVYYPTIDNTNVETLQYVVTDGSTFTDLQTRDMTYTVQALDSSGMSCRVTSSAKSGKYELVTDYLTDPARNSVVLHTALRATGNRPGAGNLKLFARFDPTVNGNGGGGDPTTANAGADDAVIDTSTGHPVPVASDTVTQTIAANRDYAQPVFAALRADQPFTRASAGYAGTASDGLTQLDATHALTTTYTAAPHGNVVQTAQVALSRTGETTLAVGFGSTQAQAVSTAGASAARDFAATAAAYAKGWRAYDAGLNDPRLPSSVPAARRAELNRTYWVSANTLKASEDKTFPGAIAASMSSPWGQAVAAGDPSLTYFGSYREVFARDLYETFTGLMAAGDVATAKDTVRFLFNRQQQADGSMPRNSLPNGKTAPDSFGVQLDEVAYPILMARTIGLLDPAFTKDVNNNAFYTNHIKRAADFVVAHGPSFGSERWEEQSGYSPSTIAAQIAGLVAAGAIADQNGDAAGARIYRATADHYQRSIKSWTLTSTGTLSSQPYFIRLSKNGDPNAAVTYNLGNGGPDADQRAVMDAGFLELPRLGILPATDPDVVRSLGLVDSVISRSTATGTGFYRYGTAAPGTEDGYGDCNVNPDSTDCTVQGKPWAGVCQAQAQNHGSGHLWPALAAERAEHELVTGNGSGAAGLLASMSGTASGVGLVPEQTWEDADVAASPWGTPPECASIGFTNGKAVGSASPLTWSAASYVRLTHDLGAGRITEQPRDTAARYLHGVPGSLPLTLTSPVDGSLVTGTATVSGTTAPGATVDVDAVNTDIDGAARVTTTTAAADGTFTVTAAVPPGTDTVTVTATDAHGATAFAQRTVVYDVVPGTLVYEATDPDGDDNGPGTYAYPTAADFHPGAYDLQRFQVYDSGTDSVTFRVQTRDLSPTFGSPLGAQLVDVYVHNPSGGATSTAASFPGRNYQIAAGSAWNRLIEVQGFGQRFIDASGATVGSVSIRATAVTRFITFTVSKSALGGVPASGWGFTVVLTGQDGFSGDLARGFQPTAEGYQFGVCTAADVAASNPICAVPAGTVPKAVDVITPAGVVQSDELDPTKHTPVTNAGVTVPRPPPPPKE